MAETSFLSDGFTTAGFVVSSEEPRTIPDGLSTDDLLCPICVDTIQGPFATPCGHTFCYNCITRHLENKQNCPSCSAFLSHEHIFPNFLLNKILAQAAAAHSTHGSTITRCVQQALNGKGPSLKTSDVDAAIALLVEKKEELEHRETAGHLLLLLEFLEEARRRKEGELTKLSSQLSMLDADLAAVAGRHQQQQEQGQEQGQEEQQEQEQEQQGLGQERPEQRGLEQQQQQLVGQQQAQEAQPQLARSFINTAPPLLPQQQGQGQEAQHGPADQQQQQQQQQKQKQLVCLPTDPVQPFLPVPLGPPPPQQQQLLQAQVVQQPCIRQHPQQCPLPPPFACHHHLQPPSQPLLLQQPACGYHQQQQALAAQGCYSLHGCYSTGPHGSSISCHQSLHPYFQQQQQQQPALPGEHSQHCHLVASSLCDCHLHHHQQQQQPSVRPHEHPQHVCQTACYSSIDPRSQSSYCHPHTFFGHAPVCMAHGGQQQQQQHVAPCHGCGPHARPWCDGHLQQQHYQQQHHPSQQQHYQQQHYQQQHHPSHQLLLLPGVADAAIGCGTLLASRGGVAGPPAQGHAAVAATAATAVASQTAQGHPTQAIRAPLPGAAAGGSGQDTPLPHPSSGVATTGAAFINAHHMPGSSDGNVARPAATQAHASARPSCSLNRSQLPTVSSVSTDSEPSDADTVRAAKKQRLLSQLDTLQQCYFSLKESDPSARWTAAALEAVAAAPAAAAGAAATGRAPATAQRGGAAPVAAAQATSCAAAAAVAATGAAHPAAAETAALAQPAGGAAAGAGAGAALSHLSHVLSAATRFTRTRVVAEVAPRSAAVAGAGAGGGSSSRPAATMVSCLDFDCQGELLAACAGSRVLLYNYPALLSAGQTCAGGGGGGQASSGQRPAAELASRSKLASLGFSRHERTALVTGDTDGMLCLWDAGTSQVVVDWDSAHRRRVWSLDCSHGTPGQFVSGSDDCTVKVWSASSPNPVLTLRTRANVCSVRYCPWDPNYLAVGSAAHVLLLYDLRSPHEPLAVMQGHRKAVSYVRFMSRHELVSASTDSSVRLWGVRGHQQQQPAATAVAAASAEPAAAQAGAGDAADQQLHGEGEGEQYGGYACVRQYTGHTNERNFVGLSVCGDLIACGSETNQVYLYYKLISKPYITHNFSSTSSTSSGGSGPGGAGGAPAVSSTGGGGGSGSGFISALCWHPDSQALVAANSQGLLRVLALEA